MLTDVKIIFITWLFKKNNTFQTGESNEKYKNSAARRNYLKN